MRVAAVRARDAGGSVRLVTASRELPLSPLGGWGPAPASPALPAAEIHVWRTDLDALRDDLLASLSADERARAAQSLRPRPARRWARSRGALRSLLGRYLDVAPAHLRFAADSSGKPRLAHSAAAGDPAPPLCFNVSHSGRLALFAFARRPVGVDVELDRRPLDEVAIAARAFSGEHARRIARLHPSARRGEFLRLWARHEALHKCRGGEIWRADEARDGAASATAASDRVSPWLIELAPAAGAAGALAAAAGPCVVRCWAVDGG
jgi:4'-phosphopantetheinyl transferase